MGRSRRAANARRGLSVAGPAARARAAVSRIGRPLRPAGGEFRNGRVAACLTLLLLARPCAAAAQDLSVEALAGTAWSLPLPLVIRQPGEPELRIRARWEAELVHHKLYLQNSPPEVERFEVSHGYHLLTLNHARPAGSGTALRFGMGVVIGHPESVVRGRPVGPVGSLLGGGYLVSGITAQVAVGRPVEVGRGVFAVPDAKLTASPARMPLAGGGWVRVPNVAAHAPAGLGYRR